VSLSSMARQSRPRSHPSCSMVMGSSAVVALGASSGDAGASRGAASTISSR
jgi:hypothetical protein